MVVVVVGLNVLMGYIGLMFLGYVVFVVIGVYGVIILYYVVIVLLILEGI